MKIGVEIKINVNKIDKTRLFEGKNGKYLTVTGFIDIDQKDEYGNNGMITQSVPKEEREQGVRGAILGNSKVFWSDMTQQSNPPPQESYSNNTGPMFSGGVSQDNLVDNFEDQDIPF